MSLIEPAEKDAQVLRSSAACCWRGLFRFRNSPERAEGNCARVVAIPPYGISIAYSHNKRKTNQDHKERADPCLIVVCVVIYFTIWQAIYSNKSLIHLKLDK